MTLVLFMRWVGTAFLLAYFLCFYFNTFSPWASELRNIDCSYHADKENSVGDDAKCIFSDSEQAETGLCETSFDHLTAMGYSHHSDTCCGAVLYLVAL